MNPGRTQSLPAQARALLAVTTAAALAACAVAWAQTGLHGSWTTFVLLAVPAALAQLLVVPTGRNHGFHTAFVFVTAAALLLAPGQLALLGIAQHGLEGRVKRHPWYIQLFNVSNTTLNVLAAWGAARLMDRHGPAAWVALVTVIATNHLLLAAMLRLARGRRVRETQLFSLDSLLADAIPAALGVVVAAFWHSDPWLIPAALAPVALAQRTFAILGRLGESEDRLRTTIESSPTGIALTSLDGTVATVNPALEAMLGYPAAELVGRRWEDVLHPDDVEHSLEEARRVAAGDTAQHRFDTRYVAKSGETIFATKSLALVRDNEGQPTHVLATIEDVTERRQLADRLTQSQKMEAIGRLAGGVAHDFNNMLTAITAYSDLALRRLDAGQPVTRRPLEEIKKAADRSAMLTARLLAFSRKQTLKRQLLEPNAIVVDLEGMLERLIGGDVRIETELDPRAGRITADPGQLEQVVVNLVVNAHDALPEGGTIRIATQVADVREGDARYVDATPGRYTVVVVADDGCGMSAATREHVFEPFFTTKDEGTGLGLATVYGIVAQSGGFIELDSEPGRGTTFRLYFPEAAGPTEPLTLAPAADPGSDGGVLLLVEDEAVVREMVGALLTDAGWQVEVAASGEEALEVAGRLGRVDVLLTDVVMPGIDGVQLARRLLDDGHEPQIVFMSGFPGEALEAAAHLGASYRFLPKPFTATELHAELQLQYEEVA